MAASGPMVVAAEKYFDQRKALGYRPRNERQLVLAFARQMDTLQERSPSLGTVVAWARATRAARAQAARRSEVVRRFLTRVGRCSPKNVVLPPGYLGKAYLRRSPHIYSDAEVGELMQAAMSIGPAGGLRSWTYRTLFGLLLSTGMRVGEALALDAADVDWVQGALFVRRSKTGPSRTIPVHTTTLNALRDYQARRDARHPIPRSPAFFLTERLGTRLAYGYLESTFRMLRADLGWTRRPLPRVHDMRHTFAVNKLLEWIRAGNDVDAEMPALSAYLGHVRPSGTYWYLSAVPELMQQIATGLEKMAVL
jgi:integrase